MTNYTGNASTTTPTINTASSTTILAANVNRKYLFIQNNSAANIAINLAGATLTGIAPTATNFCIVLGSTAGTNYWSSNDMFVPQGAITAYQTSGSTINTVTVVEG